jgi:hypothetical protein
MEVEGESEQSVFALAALPSRKERKLGGLQTYLKKRRNVLAFKIFYFYLI